MDKPFYPRPLVNTFGIAAVVAGLAGILVPVSTSTVITAAFPGVYGQLWFFGLFLCGIAALVGDRMHRFEGTILVGVGLGVGACFLFSYGILLAVVAGWPSLTAASFILTHAGACLLRANHIRLRNQRIGTSLRSEGT